MVTQGNSLSIDIPHAAVFKGYFINVSNIEMVGVVRWALTGVASKMRA